jgi:hypothetical protein
MQNQLNTLRNAKNSLKLIEDANNSEFIEKQLLRTDVSWISNCWEIARCSNEMKSRCRCHIQKTSCWLYSKKCPCPTQEGTDCENCHFYQWHLREVNLIQTRPTRKNSVSQASFLRHIEPIFRKFSLNGNEYRTRFRRRRKVMKLIALQILASPKTFRQIPLERFLNDIFEKLFTY